MGSACWPDAPPPTLMKRPTSISYKDIRSSRNVPELEKPLTEHEDIPSINNE